MNQTASASQLPPFSFLHLPSSIPHPQSSIFTPHSSLFNPPSSGPDVNPPSSDLGLSSSSSVFLPPSSVFSPLSSFLSPQSYSAPAIASIAPNPVTGSGFSPDTQETRKIPSSFIYSAASEAASESNGTTDERRWTQIEPRPELEHCVAGVGT
jgi:hypothetical protein